MATFPFYFQYIVKYIDHKRLKSKNVLFIKWHYYSITKFDYKAKTLLMSIDQS